jgi:DNA repair protein RadC
MEPRHFPAGGGVPGVTGRDARPLEDVEEAELFRRAFPDDGEGMRLAVLESAPADAGRHRRWEAVLELARRAFAVPRRRPEPFRSAADVFERYRFRFSDSPVEVFVVVLLDVKHRPLREERVSEGILDGSLIHPREVFAAAVRERAAAVLLLHNHPSGDPCPSGQDREVTRRLRSAGGILGIPVVDHVILGDAAFFSFREEGDW